MVSGTFHPTRQPENLVIAAEVSILCRPAFIFRGAKITEAKVGADVRWEHSITQQQQTRQTSQVQKQQFLQSFGLLIRTYKKTEY